MAETTTSVEKLNEIEQYHAHNMIFTRFDYSTGDAAGQNMTSKATYGGGTNLPTQRECLQIMDCHGPGKVLKLVEIAAALALAGEISLGAAARVDKETRTNEWVAAHEKLGRNRPSLPNNELENK